MNGCAPTGRAPVNFLSIGVLSGAPTAKRPTQSAEVMIAGSAVHDTVSDCWVVACVGADSVKRIPVNSSAPTSGSRVREAPSRSQPTGVLERSREIDHAKGSGREVKIPSP